MKSIFVVILFSSTILLALPRVVLPSKILFLLPIASKSHVHVFEPLVRALGEKGHDITSFTPLASKGMPSNVKEIVVIPVENIFKDMPNPFEQRKTGKLASENDNYSTHEKSRQIGKSVWILKMFTALTNTTLDEFTNACSKFFDSKELKQVMTQEFDLVVVDILLNYCLLGLVIHFKSPFMFISTMSAPSYVTESVGVRLPSSFVPSPFLDYGHQMDFKERLFNWGFNLAMDVMGYFIFIPQLEKVYKDKMGIEQGIFEISSNVSMILVNSHFTLTYPRPYFPDIQEVGGMHVTPAKPLPKDLEEFISGAEHGCILFSLGSIAKGKDMPEEYREIFVRVFSKLKQRVLWKWETGEMPDLPKNVKLSKWLPQQDVLGHKNIKLFMTHGGLLSLQEAVYNGVALIGIPLFADQDLNIKQAVNMGIAVPLEILDLSEEMLAAKLKEALENPVYRTRAKELSFVWRDQPLTPLEAAVFYTEYVIRHKGARHMRSAARDLNFFQYYCLDIIAFVTSALFAIWFLFICTVKFLWKKLCKKRSGQSNTNTIDKKRN